MAKKVLKKSKKLKTEKAEKSNVPVVLEPELVSGVSEPEPMQVVQEPMQIVQEVKLPEGVLKKEEVEVNGKKYYKLWKDDGTTYLEAV